MISTILSQPEQEKLIRKLEIFKIQGTDKRGHPILRIIGKHFPARLVGVETLKKYLEEEIFPSLEEKPFSVVYVNTNVNKSDNFAGISAMRTIYAAVPVKVRDHLQTFYFLHPGIQSRLFLATVGRFLFSSSGGAGLYEKVKYVSRVEFLWCHIRQKGIEIPEFVHEFDEEMECRPTRDYGLEIDHPGIIRRGPESYTVSSYSTRCIA
ncbi:hypothetical protein CASFOL_016910 [Castilleja foliolosa]|uniref:CRAL-TRIO domain-containing protein n=1 Tax=Castilleja foliolosa TaxID=1961234 RepID=A0ABD3DA30_9LAMI